VSHDKSNFIFFRSGKSKKLYGKMCLELRDLYEKTLFYEDFIELDEKIEVKFST
jgi:hypothetical protein